MNDAAFEDTLRRRLRDLAELAPREPAQPLEHREVPRLPTARRRPALIAAAVVVLAAVVALAISVGRGSDTREVVTEPSLPGSDEHLTVVPDGPGYGKTFPVVVWSGRELIVWGGEIVSEQEWSNEGGAYDPSTRQWRPLAASPLPAMSEHTAVWTGEEVLICCGRIPGDAGPVAGAYRPDTDTWRTIALPPFVGAPFAQSVWTGEEMIVTGGSHLRGAAAYDPATDTWRTLSDPPGVIERVADAMWTGDLMVVWNQGDYSVLAGYTYDPATDTWTTLPELPDELRLDGGSGAVVDNELFVWGSRQGADGRNRPAGARLDLDERRWTALPPAPVPPTLAINGAETSASLAGTGDEVIVFTGYLGSGSHVDPTLVLVFDPRTDEWRSVGSVEESYHPPLVWADDRAFLFGGELVTITP
jgi:hypothetical protein